MGLPATVALTAQLAPRRLQALRVQARFRWLAGVGGALYEDLRKRPRARCEALAAPRRGRNALSR